MPRRLFTGVLVRHDDVPHLVVLLEHLDHALEERLRKSAVGHFARTVTDHQLSKTTGSPKERRWKAPCSIVRYDERRSYALVSLSCDKSRPPVSLRGSRLDIAISLDLGVFEPAVAYQIVTLLCRRMILPFDMV